MINTRPELFKVNRVSLGKYSAFLKCQARGETRFDLTIKGISQDDGLLATGTD